MSNEEQLAKTAFEAYANAVQWQAVNGKTIPQWADAGYKVKEGWRNVVKVLTPLLREETVTARTAPQATVRDAPVDVVQQEKRLEALPSADGGYVVTEAGQQERPSAGSKSEAQIAAENKAADPKEKRTVATKPAAKTARKK